MKNYITYCLFCIILMLGLPVLSVADSPCSGTKIKNECLAEIIKEGLELPNANVADQQDIERRNQAFSALIDYFFSIGEIETAKKYLKQKREWKKASSKSDALEPLFYSHNYINALAHILRFKGIDAAESHLEDIRKDAPSHVHVVPSRYDCMHIYAILENYNATDAQRALEESKLCTKREIQEVKMLILMRRGEFIPALDMAIEHHLSQEFSSGLWDTAYHRDNILVDGRIVHDRAFVHEAMKKLLPVALERGKQIDKIIIMRILECFLHLGDMENSKSVMSAYPETKPVYEQFKESEERWAKEVRWDEFKTKLNRFIPIGFFTQVNPPIVDVRYPAEFWALPLDEKIKKWEATPVLNEDPIVAQWMKEMFVGLDRYEQIMNVFSHLPLEARRQHFVDFFRSNLWDYGFEYIQPTLEDLPQAFPARLDAASFLLGARVTKPDILDPFFRNAITF